MTYIVVVIITMAIYRAVQLCVDVAAFIKIVVCHQPALIASAMMTTVCSLTAIRP